MTIAEELYLLTCYKNVYSDRSNNNANLKDTNCRYAYIRQNKTDNTKSKILK